MRSFLHNFDQKVTTVVQAWQGLGGFFAFVTHLGHPLVTLAIGAMVAIVGGARSNFRLVAAGGMVFAAMGVSSLLKLVLRRERPFSDYVFHMFAPTFSFPSGHAVGSTVAYGLLAYLSWAYLPQPWNIIVAVIFGLLILSIGLSRIYLGAHYPTDVIAGWCVGIVGLVILIVVIKP